MAKSGNIDVRMGLNRIIPAAFLAMCNTGGESARDAEQRPSGGVAPEMEAVTLSARADLEEAVSLLHVEAKGPHCGGTAEKFANARVVETPRGARIQIGQGHYTVKAIRNEAGRRVVWVRSTPDSPSGVCREFGLDGIAENDVEVNRCD